MDYLDPNKKRQKKKYLLLMYGLLGIAIAIATVVLVYLVNGYSIDKQTGEVIQNGLIYVDTKPESAEIYLNGQKQRGRTDARLVVPAGTYDIQLRRDGYQNWQRELTLEGGSLRRLSYARLIPEELETEVALDLTAAPTMTSQSIDKRWLVMMFVDNPLLMRVVDLNQNVLSLTEVQLPLTLIDSKEAGSWEVVDWADDNKTFLAVYRTATTAEYVLIDREDPLKARKLKEIFATTPFSEVSLRGRKNDLLYLFDAATGILSKANSTDATVESVLSDVIEYTTFDDDAILYITAKDAVDGMVTAYLDKGDTSYKLRNLTVSDRYMLDMSKLGSALVLGVVSPSENRAIVYNDPIAALKQNDFSTIPVPTTVLRVENPEELSISADSTIIAVRGGSSLATHEFDADRSYSFSMREPIDVGTDIRWLDGQHFVASSNRIQYMADFDGSNQYQMVNSLPILGSYLDKDLNLFFSFIPPQQEGSPYRIMKTFMRTEADR